MIKLAEGSPSWGNFILIRKVRFLPGLVIRRTLHVEMKQIALLNKKDGNNHCDVFEDISTTSYV